MKEILYVGATLTLVALVFRATWLLIVALGEDDKKPDEKTATGLPPNYPLRSSFRRRR
jgi:hypothetical protein